MWSGRRQGWWREISSSVRVLISLRLLPRRLRRLVFFCWVLLRASWVWICVILMLSKRSSSRLLEEDVFMRLPPGCGEMSGKIVRLNLSLYGLKQASRSWHNHLLTHMKYLGFEQSPADACVMRLIESGSCLLYTSPSPRDGLLSRMPSSA